VEIRHIGESIELDHVILSLDIQKAMI